MIKKDKKIAIIGSGALGSAIGKVLHDAGSKDILIYGIDDNELKDLKKGINTKYFPSSIKLPKFKTTKKISEAIKDASYVFLAVPSKIMNVVFEDIISNLDNDVLIINGSKGFFPNSNLSLHQGLLGVVKGNKFIRGVVSLIGPSHASEIVREIPTFVASVSKNIKLAEEVQMLVNNSYYKTFIQTDVRGAEVGAAFKNVLAIASGIFSQMGGGINTTAAFLSMGMKEMALLNKTMKGKIKTIMGLTGLGDLIVTATSDLSRNYSFGKEFAKKGKKALATNKTVEGLIALEYIYNISKNKKIELPIVDSLYKTIFENQTLEQFKDSILKNDKRFE